MVLAILFPPPTNLNFYSQCWCRFYKGACLGRENCVDLVQTFFYSLPEELLLELYFGLQTISKISKYVFGYACIVQHWIWRAKTIKIDKSKSLKCHMTLTWQLWNNSFFFFTPRREGFWVTVIHLNRLKNYQRFTAGPAPDFFFKQLRLLVVFPIGSSSWYFFSSGSGSGSKGPKTPGSDRLRFLVTIFFSPQTSKVKLQKNYRTSKIIVFLTIKTYYFT